MRLPWWWQVDREGTGNITPEAINAFLADVGLEATPFDMRHIMMELDPSHTGVVSRTAFISFIRHGGQPPAQPQVGARCSCQGSPGHLPCWHMQLCCRSRRPCLLELCARISQSKNPHKVLHLSANWWLMLLYKA